MKGNGKKNGWKGWSAGTKSEMLNQSAYTRIVNKNINEIFLRFSQLFIVLDSYLIEELIIIPNKCWKGTPKAAKIPQINKAI